MAKKATQSKKVAKAPVKQTRKTAKRKTAYETVVSNIQKITYASGRTSYRVRVAGNSEFTTSLKKAREIKKAMLA
ncbi:MAG: hypothetical protein ACO21S_09110 [Sediminibacterium sp.]|jgi:hypothetical protein